MGLKKLAAKVIDYNERLERGEASKIKASHVRKVIQKLRWKRAELEGELASASDSNKKKRIERKLDIARKHEERAEWLLREIE